MRLGRLLLSLGTTRCWIACPTGGVLVLEVPRCLFSTESTAAEEDPVELK